MFPPSMWTVKIEECKSDNILREHIIKEEAIYPKGFNIKYNHGTCSLFKLCKYMRGFKNKQTTGIRLLDSISINILCIVRECGIGGFKPSILLARANH